jgi:hypothetical protein
VFDGFGIAVLAALGTVLGWAIKKFKTAALFDKVGELFNRKTAKIYVHPIGKPVWHAAVQPSGAVYMQVIIQARINHDSSQAVVVVDSYPKGTVPIVSGMVIFIVPPNAMVEEHLSSIAAPMVGKKGKDWTGRLVLVDHLRRKHKTDKITFMWVG